VAFNFKEGMRRLSLVLGVVGAGIGAFFAYLGYQSLVDAYRSAERFHNVLSSPRIQSFVGGLQNHHLVDNRWLDDSNSDNPPKRDQGGKWVDQDEDIKVGEYRITRMRIDPQGTGFDQFELESGESIDKTPAPSVYDWLLPLAWPVLGFFLPWGAVRTIGWVAGGFAFSRG